MTATVPYVPRLRLLWSLVPATHVEVLGADALVTHPSHQVRLPAVDPLVVRALQRMQLGAVALQNVDGHLAQDFSRWLAGKQGSFGAWRTVSAALDALGGLVTPALAPLDGSEPLVSLPAVRWDTPPVTLQSIPSGLPLRLVDGAQLRDTPQGKAMHVPGAVRLARLHGPRAERIATELLAGVNSVGELAARAEVDDLVAYEVSMFIGQRGVDAIQVMDGADSPC